MGLNIVVLEGNLTRDPETKQTNSGKTVVSGGLAVNNGYMKDGEWVNQPCFVDLEAWEGTADRLGVLSKGDPVVVQGELKMDQWEKDGEKRTKLKVRVNKFKGPKKAVSTDKVEETPTDEGGIPF